jgi:head-tail adaptor
MRNIRAGALRTPVFLGRPVITIDATGAEQLAWDEQVTWALIEPLTGREWANAAAVKDAVDCRITVRMQPGWTPDARWRVRDNNGARIYNIVTAMLIPNKGAVECLAKTAQGNSDGR